jgi:hypothetical protein
MPQQELPKPRHPYQAWRKDPIGYQVDEHRQVVSPVGPAHFVCSHPDYGFELEPRMRRILIGEKHPPHPRFALAVDLAGSTHRRFAHQGQGVGLES